MSGVYLAKFTNQQGYENYATFAVRDDQRQADILFERPTTTDQAYNNFPNVNPATPGFDAANPAHVGKSPYTYISGGAPTVAGEARAVEVSYNRPTPARAPAGC